jgi:hypothetical protein
VVAVVSEPAILWIGFIERVAVGKVDGDLQVCLGLSDDLLSLHVTSAENVGLLVTHETLHQALAFALVGTTHLALGMSIIGPSSGRLEDFIGLEKGADA